MEPREHPYETLISAFGVMRIPPDLLACELWLALALLAIYLPVLNESFLRVIFGIPVVLFIPGYALIAALFPAARDLDGIERVALSFGLSIAIVPLIGLVLNYTPWGIRLDPIVICLSVLTVALCLAAQFRRAHLPAEDRFVVPFAQIRQGITDEFFPPGETTRTDRILSLVLLIAIIAAVGTTIFVIVVPKEGEKFTEFFILGERQKAADYPTSLMTGENRSLFIGIGNHEYRPLTYTVEVYFLNMSFDPVTNTSSVDRMTRIDRFTVPVSHNQTIIQPYFFTPRSTQYNRLEFLLFNDTVLDESITGMDRINRSYRDLHLWTRIRSA